MIYDVDQQKLINIIAEELKKKEEIKAPIWSVFVKTGVHKERAPTQKDWWYIRVAAVLRTIMLRGPIGTGKLRIKYGGKKNRGMKPERFFKGSGSIARKAMQQLEKAGLVKKAEKGVFKGRILTNEGYKFLHECAKKVK